VLDILLQQNRLVEYHSPKQTRMSAPLVREKNYRPLPLKRGEM